MSDRKKSYRKKMSDRKWRYRVCDDNSVLNYYSTRDNAKAYLADLKKYSPDVHQQARIQKLTYGNNWHTLSNLCY